jgi:predicted acylesterase/phospholipase RssA
MDQETLINPPSTDIALCFSGGGYRAAAFHLGTLAMLHELGMGERIKYFSTASGGTIVAMKYVIEIIKGTPFENFAADFEKFLLDHNVVKDAFDAITETRFEGQKNDVSLIRAAGGIYDEHLTRGLKVQHLKDEAIETGKFTDLIFNVTEFRTGGGFRFRMNKNERLTFGSGNFEVKNELQGQILLADIVAASSCFPGAFEPIRFPEDFDLPNREMAKFPFQGKGKAVESLPMMDGGIFDNQGVAGLMTSYEEAAPFDFVLISDTTQKPKTILDYKIAERGALFAIGRTFYAILALLSVVFISSVILIGFALANISAVPVLQVVSTEIAAVFSAIVSGAFVAALVYGRFKLGSLDIMGAKFPIWSYIRDLKVADVISLINTRVSSAKVLAFNVFMKRIRDLNNKTVLAAAGKKDRRNMLFGKNVFSLIYDLEDNRESEMPLANDKEIKSTPRMQRISKAAGEVPTSLWITKNQFDILVECGRITACLALLRLSWAKWQKATADAQETDENAVLPMPNNTASPLNAGYEKVKKKWDELVKGQTPDAPET